MIFSFLLILLIPSNSFAYLDPGTGAMVIQAVIAAFAGTVFFLKKNWGKIKAYLNKSDIKEESSEDKKENINKAS